MYTDFHQQSGIVTGAGSGLGLAIARKLSEAGVKLALLDKNPALLEKAAAQIPGEVITYAVDITNEAAVKDVIAQIKTQFGSTDILVNSAGITGMTNIKSHETDTDNLRLVFDVNFMGAWFTSKHVLPHMLEKNYGRILHIASIAGKEGNAGMLAYSASKAAVIGMTKVQGKDYAETGITVNALAPAVIRTALVDAMPPEQVRYMTDKIPMKRCGTLDEAAAMALYITSPQNSFTTGFTFDLSGGRATY
ncbi:MAG: SDR family oxidoreductase [Chitinophaga sp.]|uniref:SDR family NAD(P)-dependent oxidoreductase n=1 Tax=Chitinophaga sp. TaxID=1869181 RepID=UPI001B0E8513|nr:SDR family NAD(P)-dependent oxidoreductase [Chitinophaga sp.]MBO9731357.1 SDR family oxidoreductase [Chitinophaga sp.]